MLCQRPLLHGLHNIVFNKIPRAIDIPPPMAVRRGISTVQSPNDCFWSGSGNGLVAVALSATSGGRTANADAL